MSHDAAFGGRSASPMSAGRSTPVPRTSRQTEEDALQKSDKHFRKYAALIDRALASWEISPEEWADYIAFLGRLLKAIQSRPKDVTILPHSTSVASKLSQCMNPALPSGVHQKALEIYTYVFSTFGCGFVSSHLDRFFPGLAAVLSFASLTVRPALYDIMEEYIVPLSPIDLRPLLKALVLSMLPALEEETGEDFQRAFRILETLQQKFAQPTPTSASSEKIGYFWQCLFLAVITSPPRRQGALNFLAHKLPKFGHGGRISDDGTVNGAADQLSSEAEATISPEPGLLIRAFVCGLSDSQILIQRGFLDLLVTKLPLSSPLLQTRIRKDDLDRLVTAALHVLVRREMSLNRRLWSWFLGPEPKGEAPESHSSSPVTEKDGRSGGIQLEYFLSYGKPSLDRTVLAMFNGTQSTATGQARPFRLCLSLMDRWEIGGSVVPDLFLPAMETAYKYSQKASTADTADVIRSASLFFDSIEATLIWSKISSTIDSASKKESDGVVQLRFCSWIIQHFNIRDEEMVTTHIPRCLLLTLHQLENGSSEQLEDIRPVLWEIASILLEAIPQRAFFHGENNGAATIDRTMRLRSLESTIDAVRRSYHTNGAAENNVAEVGSANIVVALSRALRSLAVKSLQYDPEIEFGQAASLLSTLFAKAPDLVALLETGFLLQIADLLLQNTRGSEAIPFSVIASLLSLVSTLKATPGAEEVTTEDNMAHLESILTPQIWRYLSPSEPKYHVEATRAVWQMYELASSGGHLEATLTTLIQRSRPNSELVGEKSPEAARRFTVLWSHTISAQTASSKAGTAGSLRQATTLPTIDTKQSITRHEALVKPLMLVLDMLAEPQNSSHAVVKSWLHSLSSLEQVLHIHFEMLDDLLSPILDSDGPDSSANARSNAAITRDLEYIMGHFDAFFRYGNEWVLECLSNTIVQSESSASPNTGLIHIVDVCSRLICEDLYASTELAQTATGIVEMALSGSDASTLKSLKLDVLLVDRLLALLERPDPEFQSSLLKLITKALKLRFDSGVTDEDDTSRSRRSINSKRPSTAGFKPSPNASSTSLESAAPAKLLLLLRTGFSLSTARLHLDKWLDFLSSVLPVFADAIFSGLIQLVECMCKELDKAHAELINASQNGPPTSTVAPEPTIIALLQALEMVLARAHRCLEEEKQAEPEQRPATQPRGLLGNVTSGVFKSEAALSRTAHANSRLTVILTFQDAIRVSLRLWTWASHSTGVDAFDKHSAATTSYNALKVRNRTRHLLEQIFAVEPLESLEVVMSAWRSETAQEGAASSLSLLHVLQGTRPKNVIPAILDALCSRTNPSALPPDRLSTQSTGLTASDVAMFLSAYLESTEDDAIDEVWPDCMAFLRDVLANPLPYRQVLPALLLTVLLLACKLENTNFGEQRKMRRELGDAFNRLLTAAFTTMPSGYTQDPQSSDDLANTSHKPASAVYRSSTSFIGALNEVTKSIEIVLETADRTTVAMNSISANLIGPMFRAKSFPSNVTPETLELLLQLSKKAPAAKAWKKDVLDAFNEPRLLTSSAEVMETLWFPVLYQWCLHDKERMPELLSRLTPPSSAGIMFGVGANAARLEADRRTQLILRRISVLLLACREDTFAAHMRAFNEKLAELFEATTSSSPSVSIKAELFMLCRAITLSTSSIQLAPMWPIINDNLHAALASLLPGAANANSYANLALLQACKLLDLLITLSPDEFQLHEWLYITDTIDAVYQPTDWDPSALSDQITVVMAAEGVGEGSSLVPSTPIANSQPGQRQPLLDSNSMGSRDDFKAMAREDFAGTVLRPFLSQLSMYAYEATYSMNAPDLNACRRGLLEDLLDLSTVVE